MVEFLTQGIRLGENIISQYPIIITVICGILFFLLTRSSDIIVVFKTKSQRTEEELLQVAQGLKRSLVLEMLLFVPSSIILFRFTIFPLVLDKLLTINQNLLLWYAFMGVIGYGFPFVTVRQIITKIALNTLKEFAEISIKNQISN